MRSFLDKIFFRSNNLDSISQNIKDISKNTPANKIFNAINNYSKETEAVGLDKAELTTVAYPEFN